MSLVIYGLNISGNIPAMFLKFCNLPVEINNIDDQPKKNRYNNSNYYVDFPIGT